MNQTLDKFKEHLKKMRQYEQAVCLLNWDLQTMAPKKGVESKLETLGFFSTESFKLSTSEEYGAMLQELSRPELFAQLDEGMQLTVKRGLRDYQRFQRVPQDFYTDYVTTSARSEKMWEEAKRAGDFSLFSPWLDKMISMTRQYVGYMEPEKDVYEVLLDMYEEGMDSATIDRIFDEMKEGLLPLLSKIAAAGMPDLSALEGHYDIDAQKKVQNMLLSYIGFDFDGGAVAESEHPFTMGICHGDIRTTNHYLEDAPLSAIFSAIHEGGHAIFEQNIDPVFVNTAVEQVNLMGLHESQSRFFENMTAELMELMGEYSELNLRRCLTNSAMLSSDVSAGYDPAYASCFEKKNSAFLGNGMVFNKFTGSRGKSGSNDANAEYVAHIRDIMDSSDVVFQTAELGKVDVGGGGTIAYIMALYGMNVIDCGVAVLNMHAPWEATSKADVYETMRGYVAFLEKASF